MATVRSSHGLVSAGTKITVSTKSKVFSNIDGLVYGQEKHPGRLPMRIVEGITEYAFDSTIKVIQKNVSEAVEKLGNLAAALVRRELLPWNITTYDPNKTLTALRIAKSTRTDVHIITGTLSKAIQNQSPKTARINSQSLKTGGQKYIRINIQVGVNQSMVREEQEALEDLSLANRFPMGTTPDYGAGLFVILFDKARRTVIEKLAKYLHELIEDATRHGRIFASKVTNSENAAMKSIIREIGGLNAANTRRIQESARNRKTFIESKRAFKSKSDHTPDRDVALRNHKAERNSRKTSVGQQRREHLGYLEANRRRHYGKPGSNIKRGRRM